MKRFLLVVVVIAALTISLASCEAESVSETENTYGIDKDKVVPPGGQGIDKNKVIPPGGNG